MNKLAVFVLQSALGGLSAFLLIFLVFWLG